MALLFINIGWCVFLTEERELNDFSSSDDFVFVAFVFAEVLTVLLAFFMANKGGKVREILSICKHHIEAAVASEHKCHALDRYSNLILKKYFNDYTYRIIVFSPKEGIFAYRLERFHMKTLSWQSCYDVPKCFGRLDDLYDDLDACFEDVILED